MNQQNQIFAESRARAICERHGIDDYETMQRIASAEAYRGFMQEIQPLISFKTRFFMRSMPSIVLYPDGHLESSYTIPPEVQTAFDQIDELIARIARSWGCHDAGER